MPIKAKITDPTKILTFANMISLGRAVLAVPIVYTLRDPSLGYITFSLIIIAIIGICTYIAIQKWDINSPESSNFYFRQNNILAFMLFIYLLIF